MRAPVLAAGDGALAFRGALREVFPQARERSVDAPYLVALVRAGARFERDVLLERDEVTAA
jgi:hypothetical protein